MSVVKIMRLPAAVLAGYLLLLLVPGTLAAEDIRIIAPYLGVITDKVDEPSYQLDLKETVLLKGLYLQWINPEYYQWNVFGYQASDVNYSDLWGVHFIFDYYPASDRFGKYLLGAGCEIMNVKMDAGNDLNYRMGTATYQLQDFTMTNAVIVPYFRAGKYFLFGDGMLRTSVLPWAGIQPEWVRGDLEFLMPGRSGYTRMSYSLDDYLFYGVAGINLKFLIGHFADLEVKYQASFNANDYLNTVTLIANGYLSRNWGLSYRMKYLETSSGSDLYHLFGVAFIF